ncbi:hypothetical protein Lfu02_27530 [Longispora fulva]|uniref:Uncharacterized protein n=1 Tax=Longispora fulva TaxID=619741 RepID=A0A8J7GE18_9ACTN|nr:hypothetical protein [Longispora fulva]MBG6138888.1 hypothetical protein [Longispora fulva]GIG58381.1 hypothetical protein Lfu02_27530 [Longispora fulva]
MTARLRTLLAVAAGSLLAVSMTTPAHAVVNQPVAGYTAFLDCPSGTATTGSMLLLTQGTIKPCATPRSYVFALAGYGSRTDWGGLTAYGTPYHFITDTDRYGTEFTIKPGTTVVCLLASQDKKLDCIEVVWNAAGQATEGAHVPGTDPRVQMPAAIDGSTNPTDPGCVYCWTEPSND